MTLLEIGDELKSLLDLIEADGGELRPEFEATLERWFSEIGDAQSDKLDGYCAIVRECQLRADARRKEQERLSLRIGVDESLARRLKARLQLYLEMTGQRKVETRRYKVSVSANGGKVPVHVDCAPVELPPQYQAVTVAANVDKLREAIEAGAEIGGVRLGVRGTHLRIS